MSDNEMTLFEGGNLPDYLRDVEDDVTKTLVGGGDIPPRISIRGSKFRQIVGGEEVNVDKSGELHIVIVRAAPVSRMFYPEKYSSSAEAVPPTCWSKDSETPAPDVPEDQKQAAKCRDCPQNIKGSGDGDSRACRFQQRLAVALEGELDTVYQLTLPATSVFGSAVNKHMPLQAYAKYLKANKVPTVAVLTKMYFDDASDMPKLYFKAVRPLQEDEFRQVMELKDTPAADRAVELTVSQKVVDAETAPEASSKPDADDTDDGIEEPTKMQRQKRTTSTAEAKEAVEASTSLSSLVDQWDD